MKIKELRDKADDVIQAELVEKRRHLYDLRAQAITEKLKDPTQMGKTRREIAQIKTVLRERQLAAAKKAGSAGTQTGATNPAASNA